jgi:hypothetical protein
MPVQAGLEGTQIKRPDLESRQPTAPDRRGRLLLGRGLQRHMNLHIQPRVPLR